MLVTCTNTSKILAGKEDTNCAVVISATGLGSHQLIIVFSILVISVTLNSTLTNQDLVPQAIN